MIQTKKNKGEKSNIKKERKKERKKRAKDL